MKKTLIAMAALAATGAFAQAFTFNGNLDQTVYNNASNNAGTGTAKSGWLSNGNSSSYWAISGAEDLGGGMKVTYEGRSELTMMSGAVGSSTAATGQLQATAQQPEVFNRGLWVALEGGYGKVTIGKQADIWWTTNGMFNTSASNSFGHGNLTNFVNNAAGIGTISGKAAAGMGSFTTASGNAGNTGGAYAFESAVTYATPVMSGLQVSVQSATGTYSNGGDSTGTSYALTYVNGPLKLAAATAQKNDQAGTASAWVNTVYGGSYQMGAWTFIAVRNATSFGGLMSANDNMTATSLGVNYVFSPVVDMNVSYGVISDDADTSNKATQLGIVGRYKLSARTSLYAGLGNVKNEGNAKLGAIYGASTVDTNTTTNSYMMGLKHTF
jgi:predicted porin